MDNTRGYARVSHSRQWSNYNLLQSFGKFPDISILYRLLVTEARLNYYNAPFHIVLEIVIALVQTITQYWITSVVATIAFCHGPQLILFALVVICSEYSSVS